MHHVQREFMAQTLFFFLFVGTGGVIFAKVEGTTYVDGIYFITVTTLTIGFGDMIPQTTAMKILTFPFAVIGISLLAMIVTSIIRLLQDRERRQRLEQKARLRKEESEKERIHAEEEKRGKSTAIPQQPSRTLSLQDELQALREKDWKRQRRANIQRMVVGGSAFLLFWYIGALIFHLVEVTPSNLP